MNIFYNAGTCRRGGRRVQLDLHQPRQRRQRHLRGQPRDHHLHAAPLDTTTGYTDYIVPLETRIALRHVLANDPRPHYVHQSNIAEDRIALPGARPASSTATAALFADEHARGQPADEGHRRRAAAAAPPGRAPRGRPGHRLPRSAQRHRQGARRRPAPRSPRPTGTQEATGLLGTTVFGTAYARAAASAWSGPEPAPRSRRSPPRSCPS